MKLTFKDLKQQKFVIEAEPSELISDVKNKIQAEKGWDAAQQKLIYSGKILQDGNTVSSYNIEEKGFIVCMVQKPKPAPASTAASAAKTQATPSTPAPRPAQTPAAPQAPAPAASTTPANAPSTPSPAPAAQTQPQTTTAAAPTTERSFNDPSALALGEQREAAIANMESMGFPRADIDRAMRAAFFNPDRAVEYLLTGIPEGVLREERAPARPQAETGAPAAAAPAATTGTGAAPAQPQAPSGGNAGQTGGDEPVNLFEAAAAAGGGGRGAGARGAAGGNAGAGQGLFEGANPSEGANPLSVGDLDFLRNNPQFQQLRQVVQQQPQMLEPILQQVGAGNPQLAQLIAQHPDQFLSLLAEGGPGGDDDEGGNLPMPPGAQMISVTPDENEAIERLCRLGFDRQMVIQAYFACDKNEELAANFLFDQPDDDEQ